MSHHNNQEFPGVLIDEMDRILVQIRQINDQAEALITRARDIAALAKRTVSENIKVHLESLKAEDRIRQADQVIEREAQREVERREQSIDEGRIIAVDLGCGYRVVIDAAAIEEALKQAAAATSVGDNEVELAPGITTHKDTPQDVVDEYYRRFGTMLDRSEEHDANGGNLMPTDEDLARGPIVADAIDATKIEESLPGQAEGVNTGAAEVVSQQPVEAAPVDDCHEISFDEGCEVSSAVENAPEAAAEEAKVIPPEVSSAADDKPPLGDRFYREKHTQVEADAALRERQNANVREASEFTDSVLDLWNSTLLTEAQIAKRLDKTKALIMTVLEQARMDQDPRVMGKRGVVPKLPKEHMPLSAIARKIMDRPAPVAAARAGVELGDFKPPAPAPDRVEKDLSTGVCVVDLRTNKIYGKRGMWTTDEARARTIAYINNGQMYPKLVLAQRCGWRDERELVDAITPMMERLRDIGIIMTSLPTGIVIRADD